MNDLVTHEIYTDNKYVFLGIIHLILDKIFALPNYLSWENSIKTSVYMTFFAKD